jgi:hypothetical protein
MQIPPDLSFLKKLHGFFFKSPYLYQSAEHLDHYPCGQYGHMTPPALKILPDPD